MTATLLEVRDLCRDSLQLADAVVAAGGPSSERAAEFWRARDGLAGILSDLDADDGLGFAPLVLLPWVLAAAGIITAAATIPAMIRGTTRVVDTVAESTSGVVRTTEKLLQWGGWAALALASFAATRYILKRT